MKEIDINVSEKEKVKYSEKVRQELAGVKLESKIEVLLELASITRLNSSILMREGEFFLNYTTRSYACRSRIKKLFKYLYKYDPIVQEVTDGALKQTTEYNVTVFDSKIVEDFLAFSGFDLFGQFIDSKEKYMNRLKNYDKSIAYLRGAFFGGGTVTDPIKGYNLEIVADNEVDSWLVLECIRIIGLDAKVRVRNDKYVVYMKNSETICDFINNLGAVNAYFEYEEIRIKKTNMNQHNRASNFETYNLDKVFEASAKTVALINYIEDNIGIESIPENLQEVARLRKKYMGLNLKELGEKMSPALSKSGVNYRIKKIEEIAMKHIENMKSNNSTEEK